MKKGELRKDGILKTAEKLFFERGYEETSIQDILDALKISKGGFYHYFDSKIALLEEICRQRAFYSVERIRMELMQGKQSPTRKLNLLLGAVNLFAREEADFSALVLKISYLEGDVNFREHMRRTMLESLRPMTDEVVAEGIADGSFFSRTPARLGGILLALAYDINDEVCRILAGAPDNPDCVISIMELLDAYRESVELLSGASFGSIELFNVEKLMSAFRETAGRLNLIRE